MQIAPICLHVYNHNPKRSTRTTLLLTCDIVIRPFRSTVFFSPLLCFEPFTFARLEMAFRSATETLVRHGNFSTEFFGAFFCIFSISNVVFRKQNAPLHSIISYFQAPHFNFLHIIKFFAGIKYSIFRMYLNVCIQNPHILLEENCFSSLLNKFTFINSCKLLEIRHSTTIYSQNQPRPQTESLFIFYASFEAEKCLCVCVSSFSIEFKP